MSKFADGLYDRLIYENENTELSALAEAARVQFGDPSAAQSREYLIDELSARLPALLDDLAVASEDRAEKARAEVKLIAHLLREARLQATSRESLPVLQEPLKILRAVHPPGAPPNLPVTGLRRPWLFTSARNNPSLLDELRAELSAVDRVDILVSFITWSGVRKLLDILKLATAADAHGLSRSRFRILTTTYIGATEARAVNALAELPGVELRISLDGRRTRLHAKAWIFHRNSGFGTAFVGSANLSESAMVGGIEWTLKVTQASNAELFATAGAHFETLWNDPEFQHYDPSDAKQRNILEETLVEQRRGPSSRTRNEGEPIALQTWFELRPKSYQQEMLDRLAAERRHGRFRNLVVAATGTGKTVVAAFDYARLAKEVGSPPRLLFIAHRIQILKQALDTFRQVLRDPVFGDLLDGNNAPRQHEHLFATITTVHTRQLVRALGAQYWRMVVIDEAHHLPAASFDQFASTIKPHILLGLTATPERSDGQSLTGYFDARPDGSPAVSLRLWDALDQQLLAPFEYYATADQSDFSSVAWGRVEEGAQLGNIVGSNEVRARLITNTLMQYVADLTRMKGIAFCVGVDHAAYMANFFERAGLAARVLTGGNSQAERDKAIRSLRHGELKLICTCDLFNEGVDIPEVNTLLLLRPTQSPVVFQQQIGRGLRLAEGKDSCLILDFIGQYSEDFRFDTLLRAITGMTKARLHESVEHGFGLLPAGCHIQFDRVARDRVLSSLRQALQLNSRRLRIELAAWAAMRNGQPVTLREFLRDNQIELRDVYANRHSWTAHKRAVNLVASEPGPREEELSRRMGSLLHANDSATLQAWGAALSGSEYDARRAQMLAYQVLDKRAEYIDGAGFVSLMGGHSALRDEMLELIDCLDDEADEGASLPDVPADWPLALHARYARREIQVAVGHLTPSSRPMFNEGCLPLRAEKIELMFVTLDKREGFSERVQYHDYAISPELFHWQTQNRASPQNDTGKRYLESSTNGWRFQLFVREDPGSAYLALGPVILEQHEGSQPISITWRLKVPMPAGIFKIFSVLRG